MSTLKVNTLEEATAGGATFYTAKAWVNFNGTGTVAINADGNVSSITDQSTGAYFVNMTSAVTDANYVFTGLSKTPSSGNGRGRIEPNLSTQTSSGFGLWTGGIHNIITVSDSPLVMAAVIR